MVCSNCGSENPATNRFCGMCGTPLPQRPITAPGAASTLSFTRLPVESPRPADATVLPSNTTSEPAAQPVGSLRVPAPASPNVDSAPGLRARSPIPSETAPRAGVLLEMPKASSTASNSAVDIPRAKNADPFAAAERAESLEQFVAGFHYTPPSEEDEFTMTGDRPVLDNQARYTPETPLNFADDPTAIAEPTATNHENAPPAVTPPTAGAVEHAPVIPVTAEPRPEAVDRSRFLDLEPVAAQPARSGTSSVVGPSFLGLSDPPAVVAEPAVLAEPEVGGSGWRAWVAIFVVLLFAFLGYLEWRAETNQTNDGPVAILKSEIQRLKSAFAGSAAPTSDSAPAESSTGSSPHAAPTGPATQPTPTQSQPAATSESANNNSSSVPQSPTSAGNANVVSSSIPPPAVSQTMPAPTPAKPPVDTPSTSPQSKATAAPKPLVPGAEELAKANDASDASAATAWLWKSVAKGNPEAPVKLANMYIKGDGVPRSCDQAMVLLKSAAAKDNAAARSRLGSLYATGNCVPRDRVKAYQWMSASLQVNPTGQWARDYREQIWAQMTPQERSLAQKYR